MRALAVGALAAAALGAGCSGDEPSPAPAPADPSARAPAPERTENRRGLDATNEQEVAGLVRGAVRARPVRCRTERLHPGAPGLYRCTAGGGEYRVEWAHYGTGAYTITALPGGRVVARGTLSISQ
ncbi:MAG TPA: hypothetical protein VF715_04395 [Thermoleophilaceae bacterium]